jgi:predicted RNA-binding Zn-ribbon protein involved in translation (DUF1610 family)
MSVVQFKYCPKCGGTMIERLNESTKTRSAMCLNHGCRIFCLTKCPDNISGGEATYHLRQLTPKEVYVRTTILQSVKVRERVPAKYEEQWIEDTFPKTVKEVVKAPVKTPVKKAVKEVQKPKEEPVQKQAPLKGKLLNSKGVKRR